MNDPETIKNDLVKNGPIATQFNVYQDFYNYKGGVYYHVSGGLIGAHAVKILGYGNEGGLDYWLLANSWGVSWGENGFFKFKIGDCGINDWAFACKASLQSSIEDFLTME